MSFSSETKAELCDSRLEKRNLALAECYGVLLYCNTFRTSEIRIITASASFSERLPRLFKKAFSFGFDQLPPENAVGKRSFCIQDPEKITRILESFGGDAGGPISHHINLGILEDPGCSEAFVKGAFLAGGSPDFRLSRPHRRPCGRHEYSDCQGRQGDAQHRHPSDQL